MNLINQLIVGLGIDRSLFVIAFLYLICFLIIRTFFVKPFLALIESRREEIESAREIHEQTMAETEARLDEQRGRMAEARLDARNQRDEIRKDAMEKRAALLSSAKAEAARELASAVAEIDANMSTQKAEIEVRSRDLAQRLAGRLLGRAV